MYIVIPPGVSLWSYMTIPQRQGSPQDLATAPNGKSYVRDSGSIITTYYETVSSVFTTEAFSHSVTAERYNWYYAFIDTQIDNFGTFLSYNYQGYPDCVFSRYIVTPGGAFPGGTAPPTNPGNS
ncbi:hypothetical protein F5884DRAFT_856225 [Xylogone sp. PMI_703]|nr:hypothetical protein F5884DRAFT_856225 [Xylogone sp. PMI_703]